MSGIIREKKLKQQFSLYYDVYYPERIGHNPLIIALHGYGSNKNTMMKIMQTINKTDYIFVCLQGPYQHFLPSNQTPNPLKPGFGWITSFKSKDSIELHHHAIIQIINALRKEGKIDLELVFLLGYSQSVSLNYRFVFSHPNLVRGVIAINGGTPGDLTDKNKYRKINCRILHISGSEDNIYPPKTVSKQIDLLKPLVRSLDNHSLNRGHEMPPEAFPLIDEWIKSQIEKFTYEEL
jgi:phospholipase/carboxylesterase